MTSLVCDHASVSPWIRSWLPRDGQHKNLADIAAGSGRHSRWAASLSYDVTAYERDEQALASLRSIAGVTAIAADLEDGAFHLPDSCYDVVIVTNYLFRPIFADLVKCLRPGAILLYETFAAGQENYGRPTRSAFHLQQGELYAAFSPPGCPTMQVVAYESGVTQTPSPRVVARLVAVKSDQPVSIDRIE